MRIMILKSCLLLVEDTTAVACRALWRVKEDDKNLAENQFCWKRLKLAGRIINKEGVQFFVSCITAIEQNVQGKISADEEEGARDQQKIYPAISYYIAYCEISKCSKDGIFRALHGADVDPTISEIKTRHSASMNSYEDVAINKLAQVVKDHDNHATMDLIRMPNTFCRTLCRDYSSNREDVWSADRQMRYLQTTCRLVVVEQGSYSASLSKAHASLTSY